MFKSIPLNLSKILFFFTCLSVILLNISCQDDIVLPKQCNEEPDLPFTNIGLKLYTDIISVRSIFVDSKGHIIGDSLIVKRNNVVKSINIAGYICKDGKFYLNSVYNDTIVNSRIKIEGILNYNSCNGKIFYCQNLNKICTYSQIGFFNTSYNENGGSGSFYTPLLSGVISAIVH